MFVIQDAAGRYWNGSRFAGYVHYEAERFSSFRKADAIAQLVNGFLNTI